MVKTTAAALILAALMSAGAAFAQTTTPSPSASASPSSTPRSTTVPNAPSTGHGAE